MKIICENIHELAQLIRNCSADVCPGDGCVFWGVCSHGVELTSHDIMSCIEDICEVGNTETDIG